MFTKSKRIHVRKFIHGYCHGLNSWIIYALHIQPFTTCKAPVIHHVLWSPPRYLWLSLTLIIWCQGILVLFVRVVFRDWQGQFLGGGFLSRYWSSIPFLRNYYSYSWCSFFLSCAWIGMWFFYYSHLSLFRWFCPSMASSYTMQALLVWIRSGWWLFIAFIFIGKEMFNLDMLHFRRKF